MASGKAAVALLAAATVCLLATPDTAEATATTMASANALSFSGRASVWSRYALSAHQSNGQRTCGGGTQLTGWTIQTEQWWARQINTPTPNDAVLVNTLGGFFQTSPGLFTAPISGIYYASIFARCETGNCDVTLRVTFGCATIEYLTLGQTLSMYQESGSSTDCLLETNFVYNHINVMLLFADDFVRTFATGPSG